LGAERVTNLHSLDLEAPEASAIPALPRLVKAAERQGLVVSPSSTERLTYGGLFFYDVLSLNPEEYLGYLELHIEQGGMLDESGEDFGVLQGIVGIRAFSALFKGEANHAGTTPMEQRLDALLGGCELVLAVPELVRAHGSSSTVGTCWQIRIAPGARKRRRSLVENRHEVA